MFSELKRRDPEKYQRLEQKARALGFIGVDQTLVDMDGDPKFDWVKAWVRSDLLGTPTAGLVCREFKFLTSKTLTTEQQQAAADIAGFVNQKRRGTVASETSAASDKGTTASDEIAGFANRRRKHGLGKGPMAPISTK